MGEYDVRGEGGPTELAILDDRIVKRGPRVFGGKWPVETIPISAITGVTIKPRPLGGDEFTITVGPTEYVWRIKNGGEAVAELNSKIYPDGGAKSS
jgi:hypothetical protein